MVVLISISSKIRYKNFILASIIMPVLDMINISCHCDCSSLLDTVLCKQSVLYSGIFLTPFQTPWFQ